MPSEIHTTLHKRVTTKTGNFVSVKFFVKNTRLQSVCIQPYHVVESIMSLSSPQLHMVSPDGDVFPVWRHEKVSQLVLSGTRVYTWTYKLPITHTVTFCQLQLTLLVCIQDTSTAGHKIHCLLINQRLFGAISLP